MPAWRSVLGLRAGREWWGLEPPDLRCRKREHGERNDVELLSRHAGERSVSSTSHAHSHRKGLFSGAFYRVPTAHAEWGEEVPELHDTHSLFGDLIFVALISKACKWASESSFIDCSPPPEWQDIVGCERHPPRLNTRSWPPCDLVITFVTWRYILVVSTAIRNWSHEVEMKSRFYMNSNFHTFCDLLGYFCLLGTTTYFAEPSFFDFVFLYLHTLLWWLRWLQIALVARRENERRYAGGQVVDGIMPLVLMTLSLMPLVSERFYLRSTHSSLYVRIWIWIFAQFWTWLRELWRHKRRAWLSGPHWPLAQTTVPMGIKFMIRRHVELLILTFGELVMHLGVSSDSAEHRPYRIAVRFCGLLLVVGMLYMVVFAQPNASHDHPFSRGVGFKILYQVSFFAICTFMPLIGMCLELALNHPLGFDCPNHTNYFYNLFSMVVLEVLVQQSWTLHWTSGRLLSWHRGRCRTTRGKLALLTCRFVLIFTIVFLCKGFPPYSPGGWWTKDGEALIPIYRLVIFFTVIVWLNVLVTHLQLRESEAHPTPSGVPAEPAIPPVQSPLSSPDSSFTHGHGEQAACTSGDSGLPLDAAACCTSATSRSVPASVEMPADNPENAMVV